MYFDFGEILMKILMVFMVLFVGFIIYIGLYYLADTVGVETKDSPATLIGKDFEEAYTVTTYTSVGDSLIPVTTYYPEVYKFLFEIEDNRHGWGETSKGFYENCAFGSKFNVVYKTGRFSGNVYITQAYKD